MENIHGHQKRPRGQESGEHSLLAYKVIQLKLLKQSVLLFIQSYKGAHGHNEMASERWILRHCLICSSLCSKASWNYLPLSCSHFEVLHILKPQTRASFKDTDFQSWRSSNLLDHGHNQKSWQSVVYWNCSSLHSMEVSLRVARRYSKLQLIPYGGLPRSPNARNAMFLKVLIMTRFRAEGAISCRHLSTERCTE